MIDPDFSRLKGMADSGEADSVIRLALYALDHRYEDDALPYVLRAMSQIPGNATLQHVLGLLYRAQGNLSTAFEHLNSASVLAPTDIRIGHSRARAAFEAGLPSVELFQAVFRLAPNDAEIILGLAAALTAEQRPADADSLLANTLSNHPGWLAGHAALIRHRFAYGQSQSALGILDHAIAGAPRDYRLHNLKLTVLHRATMGEAAKRAAAEAKDAVENIVNIQEMTSIITLEYGSAAEIEAALSTTNLLSTGDIAIHWLRHLLRSHRYEDAAAQFDQMPQSILPSCRPYLAVAWRMTKDPRASILDDDQLIKVVDFGDNGMTDLAETLRSLHLSRHHPLDQSVRGGTQTDGPLLSRTEAAIRLLRQKLQIAVDEYLAERAQLQTGHPCLADMPLRPRFVGSWSVRLTDQGFHEAHIHGEGLISSAFYVSLPDLGTDEEAGWLILGEPPQSLGLALGPTRKIQPRVGRLVLFPSSTWHGTRPFSSGERLTVAFDVA
jgi:tetratricopeptide (TPR) repeat protein